MKYLYLCLSLILPSLAANSLNVLPAAQSWQASGGSVTLQKKAIRCSKEFTGLATLLQKDLKRISQFAIPVEKSYHKIVFWSKDQGRIIIQQVPGMAKEAYEIEISDKVVIRATEYNGAYYGTRTLLQMLQGAKKLELPKGLITDAPKYGTRSILIDVGRKFIPVEGLKDWIRMLAWSKMNELHLHLNDNSWGNYTGYRLESKIPGLSSKDGFYTWKEIRELQDFAKARGVEIVPEIDSPGHALAFTNVRPDLAQKEMNRNGFGLAYLDLSKPESFEFMKGVFDEIIPHFDSGYVHIGTDEYRINLIKKRADREKHGEHFRQYINKMNAHIRQKHNKTVRIWSGYEHLPGTTEPGKSIVIDMWETSDAENKSKAGYTFVNSTHYHTYIVPGMPYYGVSNAFLYNTWNPRIFAYNNNKEKHSELATTSPGLMGSKLHIWNDGGPTGYTWNEIARLSWTSLLVMAENNWGNKASKNFQDFKKRVAKIDQVANIALLDRQTNAKDGLLWSHKGSDKHFIANSHQALKTTSEKANLEYPWTAEFTLTRESETAGNDTLLTSDLATIYLDLEHQAKDRKTKKMITKRGVAVVRAHQAPGYEPLLAYNPDVLVFNYKVPFNQKVTLKLVGEERRTSLYVNGKLIQTLHKQTVCPIQTLGSKRPESFQGILHEAAIYDKVK